MFTYYRFAPLLKPIIASVILLSTVPTYTMFTRTSLVPAQHLIIQKPTLVNAFCHHAALAYLLPITRLNSNNLSRTFSRPTTHTLKTGRDRIRIKKLHVQLIQAQTELQKTRAQLDESKKKLAEKCGELDTALAELEGYWSMSLHTHDGDSK